MERIFLHLLGGKDYSLKQPHSKSLNRPRNSGYLSWKENNFSSKEMTFPCVSERNHFSTFPFPFITYKNLHISPLKNASQKLQNSLMDDSIREDLIGNGESDEESYDWLGDDETADSSFIYILNTILSGTARLNVLLPTVTILAFTIFAPIVTNDGKCNTVERWLMGGFLAISAVSCVFFSLTDSFRTATGRLRYGLATFHGIWTFNGGRMKPRVAVDYHLRWADLFHTSLSVIAFLTFAASHNDVLNCYHLVLPRRVTNTVPLVVGFIVSLLFVMFPSRRRGIGHPFLLQSDVYYRY